MKSCVPHQTDTLLGSYLFEPTCLFDETLPGLFIILFSQFFLIITENYSSHLIIIFGATVLQIEFAGVLRSVPIRRNEIRSIMGDDCPLSSVQVEGLNLS